MLNVIYVKFDAIGSPEEVCIVQQQREMLIFKSIYIKIIERYLYQDWCDWLSKRGVYSAKTKTILNTLNEFSSILIDVIYLKFDAIGSPKEVCLLQQSRQFLII